jgi:hypothetical protein
VGWVPGIWTSLGTTFAADAEAVINTRRQKQSVANGPGVRGMIDIPHSILFLVIVTLAISSVKDTPQDE